MVGMNDSGQRDRFLVDMKSGGVQVSMGTGYCGNNRNLERFLMVAKPGGV